MIRRSAKTDKFWIELKASVRPNSSTAVPICGPIQCVCAWAVQPRMKIPMGQIIMPI